MLYSICSNVPAKVVHDWKTLLISGQPLYPDAREEDRESEGESTSRLSQSTGSVPVSDEVKDTLLDEADFWQYRVCHTTHHLLQPLTSPPSVHRMFKWTG